MKILRIITLLVLCLSYTTLKSKKFNEQSTQFNQDSHELIQYCEKIIKISVAFEKKYTNQDRLRCATCKKGILTHGDFLGLVCLSSMDFFIGENKLSPAKKLMDEAFEIFPQKPLNELMAFMLRAANELQISCEKCSRKHWEVIEDQK